MAALRQCGRSALGGFACPSLPGQPCGAEPVLPASDGTTQRAQARLPAGRTEPSARIAAVARAQAASVPREYSNSPATQAALNAPGREAQAEKQLGRIALRNAEAVELASQLIDLAIAKLKRSRLKDVYEAKAVSLAGKLGRPGDFGSDKVIGNLAGVWQEDAFAEAVQCFCSLHGLTGGKWNVATASDYPGQEPSTEARFSVHWG
mmetsp:Transcript_72623/g.164846  ORF Transcript_72623/g.164846 Transcript_72623/m.164846 type:complete len:206 (+) Transcript_72623:51-668(+)